MNEEMKMSDVFNLPVDTLALSIDQLEIRHQYNDGITPFDAIDQAVNNHDRLTQENHKLREALIESQKIMNTLGLIMQDKKYSATNKVNRINALIDVHMDEVYTSNKQLLSKTKGE